MVRFKKIIEYVFKVFYDIKSETKLLTNPGLPPSYYHYSKTLDGEKKRYKKVDNLTLHRKRKSYPPCVSFPYMIFASSKLPFTKKAGAKISNIISQDNLKLFKYDMGK